MPEQHTQTFQNHGALWERPDGETFGGKIYGKAAFIAKNDQKLPGDKHPDWRIRDPEAEGKPIGGLWESYSQRDGTLYLSGQITIDGQKRRVSLWPANRKSENSPHWRVLPPR